MSDEKAKYAPTSQQRDLEARQENGNLSSRVVSTSDSYLGAEDDGAARVFAVEGNDLSNYRNTSPEYMTYANETEAPLASEGGAEAELEESIDDQTDPSTASQVPTNEYVYDETTTDDSSVQR